MKARKQGHDLNWTRIVFAQIGAIPFLLLFLFPFLLLFLLPDAAVVYADSGGESIPGENAHEDRVFEFDYHVEIPVSEDDSKAFDLFVPIAVDSPAQRILNFEIESSITGTIETEAVYGNRFWHGIVPADRENPSSVVFKYTVSRSVLRSGDTLAEGTSAARFLGANEHVAVDHPILEPILTEIRQATGDASKSERARAIYDWVVDNVEYKKVGTGWGNGDTFWACNERYGNCTDFHSLFISLARTEGIPARFEMGFSDSRRSPNGPDLRLPLLGRVLATGRRLGADRCIGGLQVSGKA